MFLEGDAKIEHPAVSLVERLHLQEKPDPAAMLVADPRLLGFILGAGQDERAAAIGFNDYPSLVSLILVDHEGRNRGRGCTSRWPRHSRVPAMRRPGLHALTSILVGIMLGPEEMERDIWLLADHPAVVAGRDIEDIAGPLISITSPLSMAAVAQLLITIPTCSTWQLMSEPCTDIDRPFPARLVGGPPDRHAAKRHQLELALGKGADLVGMLEPLEDDIGALEAAIASRLAINPSSE